MQEQQQDIQTFHEEQKYKGALDWKEDGEEGSSENSESLGKLLSTENERDYIIDLAKLRYVEGIAKN